MALSRIGRLYACGVTDQDELLAEAEEQIEAWLCELDGIWMRILKDGRAEATDIVAAARAEAAELAAAARSNAMRILADADLQAAAIIDKAQTESTSLLAGSARLASMQLAESEAEVLRARALAIESNATAQALALAADAAVTGRVRLDDLAALGTAVVRLRTELSRVVDAAFDALPAIEATASALNLAAPVTLPEPSPEPTKKRGFVRRLMRI